MATVALAVNSAFLQAEAEQFFEPEQQHTVSVALERLK